MAVFYIAHMYPDLMDLYGDRGNLICLKKRLEWYGHKANIVKVNLHSQVDFDQYDMLFMGGGSDREQNLVCHDLFKKADSLRASIENGLPMLFVCGAYQLLGTSYKPSKEKKIAGLSLFNFYTEGREDRLIGNILLKTKLNNEEVTVVGFENHSGRTFFADEDLQPFGLVVKGNGNNGEDRQEGIWYKNLIGTYLHGPILPKNPVIADFFINKMLERKNIENHIKLDDEIEMFAHNQIKDRLLQ